jgi:hypothetical protein
MVNKENLMLHGRRPVTISARVTEAQKRLVGTAAAMEGESVSDLVQRVVVNFCESALRERLAEAPPASDGAREAAHQNPAGGSKGCPTPAGSRELPAPESSGVR